MDWKKRYGLVTRNLQEVVGDEDLKKLLKSGKEVSVYWGTMPTGSVSLAYFFPMRKIADLLNAGFKVKILLADLHAALDSVPWNLIEKRYEYYKRAIVLILKTIGVDLKKLEFVRGSDIQLNKEYFHDLLKLSTYSSVKECKKAASEAVKLGDNPRLCGLIYPLMQALDEEYLKVDIQYAGLDQRKIMMYAREYLPKIGYKQRIELMNPMIRGLIGEKMSSSVKASKIDLIDSEEEIKKKINKAEFVEGNADNGVMALLKYMIMVIKQDKKEKLIVKRPEKFGGDVEYENYEDIEKDVLSKDLHPMDIKMAVADEINSLLKGIRNDKELKKLFKEAYE